MQTTITARHCEIPRTLRAHARRVLESVAKVAHRPQQAQIVFDVDHQQKRAELKVHLPRGATRVASAEAADFRTALDRAAEKLRRQLERASTRAQRTTAR
jgi:ribosomal subunit interface protein